MGRDSDFEGLRVSTEVRETYANPRPRGRNIEVNQ